MSLFDNILLLPFWGRERVRDTTGPSAGRAAYLLAAG
jgi:hypothetical protein